MTALFFVTSITAMEVRPRDPESGRARGKESGEQLKNYLLLTLSHNWGEDQLHQLGVDYYNCRDREVLQFAEDAKHAGYPCCDANCCDKACLFGETVACVCCLSQVWQICPWGLAVGTACCTLGCCKLCMRQKYEESESLKKK